VADLLVMVPSRERPANVARFAAAAQDTVTGATDIVFILDDDDPCLHRSAAACGRWDHVVLPRTAPGAVPKLNAAAARYAARYPVLMFAADDTVPRTRGWDEAVTSAIAGMGGTGMAYPNGLGRTDVPELVAISSGIVTALGHFGLPSIRHYWVDSYWAALGFGAGCLRYLPDVVLEHMHHTFGKGAYDHVYRMGEQFFAADRAAFEAWRADGMEADLAVVRGLVKGAA
jgi:hypothetical protein